MNFDWKRRAGNDTLLLFFHGWSMDNSADSVTGGWQADDADLLIVSDYTRLEPLPDLGSYQRIYLAAWSFGVWVAAHLWQQFPFELAGSVALNGTLRPIDPVCGIAPEIVAGTADNWPEPAARERFLLRLTGSRQALEAFPRGSRTPTSQQVELESLYAAIINASEPRNPFQRAWIGGRDRIIPPVAQRHFWTAAGVPISEEAEAPHQPFGSLPDPGALLALCQCQLEEHSQPGEHRDDR